MLFQPPLMKVPFNQTSLKQKELKLFVVSTKTIMSTIYQFPQTTYGNFYGSYSKRILSSLTKDTSCKQMASPWELRQQLLSLLFLWQTQKNDCLWLALLNLWFGNDLLMTSFHCGTFQCKKFPILFTSLTRSTLQYSSLVKYHLNALFFLTLWTSSFNS